MATELRVWCNSSASSKVVVAVVFRRGRLLAAIQDPDSIERVLRAMRLPFEAPELAAARAPPDGGGGWFGA